MFAFLRAALYRTKGGKIITEFANFSGRQSAGHDYHSRVYKFGKAAAFDSEDIAVTWFRGRTLYAEVVREARTPRI
jgi:hypothetical protein